MITFAGVIKDLSIPCDLNGTRNDLNARRTNTALYRIVSAYMDAHPPQCCDRAEFVRRCFKDDARLL